MDLSNQNISLFWTNGKLKFIQFYCCYRSGSIAVIDCDKKILDLTSTKSEKIRKIQEKLQAQYTKENIKSLIASIESAY